MLDAALAGVLDALAGTVTLAAVEASAPWPGQLFGAVILDALAVLDMVDLGAVMLAALAVAS